MDSFIQINVFCPPEPRVGAFVYRKAGKFCFYRDSCQRFHGHQSLPQSFGTGHDTCDESAHHDNWGRTIRKDQFKEVLERTVLQSRGEKHSFDRARSFVLQRDHRDMESSGDRDGATSICSLHNRVARIIVADLTGDKNDLSNREPSSRNVLTSNRDGAENLKVKENIPVIVKEKEGDDTQQHSEKPPSQTARLLSKISLEENDEELAHAIAECVKKFLKESKETSEEQVYSTIWDFGGQSVFYATLPIFLTDKAIYLLVHNLSKNLQERATAPEMEGVFERKVDLHCSKTNEDYPHFWLSSVSSLASHSISVLSEKLPKGLPPVILVCTHADQCQEDAKDRARKIYGTLRSEAKPYGKHLCKTYFVVDNTTSGRGDECPDVHRLRKEILAVTKQLPQMKKLIPIKWLRFEEALLKSKKENGEPFISLEEARMVALDECGIDDDQQFFTLLNFLHDRRILIHFDDTPELMNMVILDPQWLIDLFRKVITVKPYDPTADEHYLEEMWTKLETDGILDDKLIQVVWRPLLKKETTQNLIAVMEKFSLVCSLPSVDNQKQFLVPSMLISHPGEVANKLLYEAFIPPLFIRFNQTHPLRHPGDDADCEYLQVPLGLFPRLIVKFLQWSVKNEIRPLYQDKDSLTSRKLSLLHLCMLPKSYRVLPTDHLCLLKLQTYSSPQCCISS